jgi:hypothetical protein
MNNTIMNFTKKNNDGYNTINDVEEVVVEHDDDNISISKKNIIKFILIGSLLAIVGALLLFSTQASLSSSSSSLRAAMVGESTGLDYISCSTANPIRGGCSEGSYCEYNLDIYRFVCKQML